MTTAPHGPTGTQDQSPSPGQSTPEYLALRTSFRTIVDHISLQTLDVSGALFEKGYIPTSACSFVTTIGIPSDTKAQHLVTILMSKVEKDPSVYHGFVSILKNEGPSADTVVEQLEESFRAEQAALPARVLPSEDPHHSSPHPPTPANDNKQKVETPASPKFICPTCGKCTLKQYLSKAGCPHANKHNSTDTETETLFPFLNPPALSKSDRIMLESRLLKDTNKMIDLFASTENKIINSFVSRKVKIDQLTNFVVHLMTKSGAQDVDEIKKSVTLPQVFLSLHPFKSFFNYKIIESIVDEFGSDEDRQLMKEYVSKFEEFSQRNIFEVPQHVFHDSDLSPDDRVFVAKFTPEVHATLKDVVAARTKIADILDIEVFALQLCSVTEGCVCLRFSISANMAEKVFPLSQDQIRALHDIKIRVLEDFVSPEEHSR